LAALGADVNIPKGNRLLPRAPLQSASRLVMAAWRWRRWFLCVRR
jgi:hypothetical protein